MTATPAASNQATITAYLRGKGLSAAQIAGVLGNWQIESGLSPTASNVREGAVGLAQWEGGRRTALDNFARAAGTSETDLNTQLQFAWSELTGSERGSLSALLGTSTPQAAATVFDQQYERSSAASLPARVAAATTFAAGGIVGGSGQVPTGTGGGGVAPAGFFSMPNWWDAIGGLVSPGWALTHPGGPAGSTSASAVTGFLGSLGHWIVDGALIAFGVVMVIVAVVVISKGADSSSSGSAPAAPPGGGQGAARDVAEVAAE